VFSADPRIVREARKLTAVSFDEMLEMSSSGAGVLQLRAVEYARNHRVRIHCRSSFEDGPGTLVLAEDETLEQPMVTAVTHAYEARVTLTGLRDQPGVAGRVFGALADANVNVDMIIQNEPVSEDSKADLSFTVARDDLRDAIDALQGLEMSDRINTDEHVGKVSIVGAGMRSHPGVAAKVFRVLGESGINIEMISTSPIKISCVISADSVPEAVQAIHRAFELGSDAVREEDPSGEHRPRVTS
jgi:aspartate kinase